MILSRSAKAHRLHIVSVIFYSYKGIMSIVGLTTILNEKTIPGGGILGEMNKINHA